MDRSQFTFYESFFRAIRRISNKADRADAYDAICAYALTGEEPDLDNLPDAVAIAFDLIRPNLDASRRKAKSGRSGGDVKQTVSKQEANRKQTGSKEEANDKQTGSKLEANCKQTGSKKEKEKEKEKEYECTPPTPSLDGCGEELRSAYADWLRYKQERREGYRPTGMKSLETQVRGAAKTYGEASVCALIRECMASGYRGILFDRLGRCNGRRDNAPAPAPGQDGEADRRAREDMERLRALMKRDREGGGSGEARCMER